MYYMTAEQYGEASHRQRGYFPIFRRSIICYHMVARKEMLPLAFFSFGNCFFSRSLNNGRQAVLSQGKVGSSEELQRVHQSF